MRFTKIYFYYDYLGNFRTSESPSVPGSGPYAVGLTSASPVALSAGDVQASYFTLTAREYMSGTPAFDIRRVGIKRGADRYNEDGSPPALLLSMLHATLTLCGEFIYVDGFEAPNLCWAGSMRPPYKGSGKKPQKGVRYLTDAQMLEKDELYYEVLRRQRLLLTSRG